MDISHVNMYVGVTKGFPQGIRSSHKLNESDLLWGGRVIIRFSMKRQLGYVSPFMEINLENQEKCKAV